MTRVNIWVTNDFRVFIKIWDGCLSTFPGQLKSFFIVNSAEMKSFHFLKFRIIENIKLMIGLFVCFVALRPMSTAMVIAGRSVHLTTLFPGQA